MLPLRSRVSVLLAELQQERDTVLRQSTPPTNATAALQTTLDTTSALHEKKRARIASAFSEVSPQTGDDLDEDGEEKVFCDVCRHCSRPYWSTSAAQRATHPFKCAYRPVKCVGCGEGMRAKQAAEHICRISHSQQ